MSAISTGHAERARRLRAAEDAAERIGTTLDAHTTCAELARFVCGVLCDAAAVELLPQEAVDAAPGGAEADAGPDGAEVSPAALHRVAAEGRTRLLEPRGATASAPVSIPLLAHGRLHGVLRAARAGGGFSAHETATLHHAARLAAVHLAHAQRHAAARRTALDLQRALLAEPGRPHPNLELATRHLPAESGALVGGDWCETVRLHFGRTLLVMGDVMGHGLEAAVEMNAYRSGLREVAAAELPPHRVLRQLDTVVARDDRRRPATCLLAQLDPARGIASFASAGHLPPVVFGADGTARLLPVTAGPPLGTGAGGYEPVTRTLTPDDTLLMFTDGLVERRGEDIDASLARLARMRLPAGAGVAEALDEVLRHLGGRPAEDDVAVLAARIRRR
ncbi:SpoIIE family protein phosphatase (plasmid) [Streptomyces sp. BHT-5-2]|uniref:PP2C family protein-serine/threonine phosphatase n=1 Tax=unclassified Streptomyces TaxID=2593676 RepID=UPI001C8D3EDD|nr:GAF domain-containing SpoIIE family protein phosphatase [Streptomyces sp. BHT-5-2]QZL07619.1 SpoIIE family protein phosphatase [Streptomyces sp. BHT-5-2]